MWNCIYYVGSFHTEFFLTQTFTLPWILLLNILIQLSEFEEEKKKIRAEIKCKSRFSQKRKRDKIFKIFQVSTRESNSISFPFLGIMDNQPSPQPNHKPTGERGELKRSEK